MNPIDKNYIIYKNSCTYTTFFAGAFFAGAFLAAAFFTGFLVAVFFGPIVVYLAIVTL
jgi:hypothetical protein